MGIEAMIFDLDGTLILLPIDWGKVMEKVRSIAGADVKTFLGFVARYHGTEQFWVVHKFLENVELEAVNRAIILDNADKVLQDLCNDIALGFVTMQSRAAAEKIVEMLGIGNCRNNLGVLSAREDSATRVAQLTKAVKDLDTDPNKVLFIGDKVLDAIAAFVNKVKAVIILRNPVSLKISATDYLDEDLEVLDIHIAFSLAEAIEIAKNVYGLAPRHEVAGGGLWS